ncbi:MAG: zinc metallopeptidase [Synergistales bacterium]
MFPFLDPTFLLLIPALVLGIWAQSRVQGAFATYSQVFSRKGIRACDVARALMDRFGLSNIRIERVQGNLTDHYDPRSKVLRLSDGVFSSPSLAAIGIAAHEVGHAIQDAEDYRPIRVRNAIVPVASLTSWLAFPLFFIGLLMRTPFLMDLGILFFLGVIVFHLVTLPVEFDASARALRLLADTGTLDGDEIGGARAVLRAAALTYVAAAVMAVAQLLRLLLLRGMVGGRRD